LALRNVCSLTGARSVSDITRNAMLTMLRGSSRNDSSGIDESRMKDLERRVEKLEDALSKVNAERAH
jgi:hypothetical protein